MSMWNYIFIGAVILFIYVIYAGLIKKRNNIKEALSGIDVQLKKRHDAIPNLLKSAAKFMEHEKEIFMEVTKLRTQAIDATDIAKKFEAEQKLSNAMHSFRLQAENYPELKSDSAIVTAMTALSEAEEHIAASRRFYNSAVKDYKNALEIFPSSLIASLMGMKDEYPFFEAGEEDKKDIDVADYLK